MAVDAFFRLEGLKGESKDMHVIDDDTFDFKSETETSTADQTYEVTEVLLVQDSSELFPSSEIDDYTADPLPDAHQTEEVTFNYSEVEDWMFG